MITTDRATGTERLFGPGAPGRETSGAAPDHGRAPRGPSSQHPAGGGRVRRRGGHHLREPAPVRAAARISGPIHGTWPATARRPRRPGPTSCWLRPRQPCTPRNRLVTVRVKRLADVLEGRQRPGPFRRRGDHRDQVLRHLGPCRAYFGEKDYQQLVIVRRLVTDLSLPVEVVACPTVREPDGLALSSRNAYLSPAERVAARALYWSLLAGKRAHRGADGRRPRPTVRAAMVEVAGREELFRARLCRGGEPVTLDGSPGDVW